MWNFRSDQRDFKVTIPWREINVEEQWFLRVGDLNHVLLVSLRLCRQEDDVYLRDVIGAGAGVAISIAIFFFDHPQFLSV